MTHATAAMQKAIGPLCIAWSFCHTPNRAQQKVPVGHLYMLVILPQQINIYPKQTKCCPLTLNFLPDVVHHTSPLTTTKEKANRVAI